ncbi:hypothetical protein CPCC7001_1307 [Cyanobium sp. PCC 7001]|nr:hypothetical protein CPCC7001_1307 [Cyanobium sp. PCC 7001]
MVLPPLMAPGGACAAPGAPTNATAAAKEVSSNTKHFLKADPAAGRPRLRYQRLHSRGCWPRESPGPDATPDEICSRLRASARCSAWPVGRGSAGVQPHCSRRPGTAGGLEPAIRPRDRPLILAGAL